MTTPPAPLRIGVIGFDHWYAAIPFARRVAADPAVRLHGLVDRDPRRAAHVAALTGCDRTSTDPGYVLEDPEVDAVACFTSVDQSPGLCVAAARAGKHIVSVKPLAMTLDAADRVVEEVERAGVVFVPSESRHTSPLARRLSGLVRSGRLGELRSGTFAMDSGVPLSWPGSTEGPGWWTDPDRTAGGAWIDHAVYQLDRINALFGSPVAEVTGTTANIAHPGLPVEDYGHAVLTLESGAVVTVEDTWIAPPGTSSTRAHLVGSNGAVFHSTATSTFGFAEAGGEWSFSKLPEDTFDTLDVLLAAVHDGVPPGSGVRTARQTLATCLDFYAAARG
ncbi:Gfo/Idh/MocA family protein [Streptomyces tsukubensis]|uniref:Oxidoreductase n=1 Tax=Streptomyces tsukubensis TaxID=83656 RepID=A0A1V4AFP2_9ACTN|nr:Gfo/Idh/MocA family oxidoreductase [Streptomyces tsukubensis]OON82712.1 oxidoreductase [Streptomyces tsukubensis]QFR92113.1 gfo/Idh/MocA family oxidoreductase [Streptomyces tsukubensis]